MRLWHIDLIPYLPKSQLVAQWRELNSIFKKQDRHLLINYIYMTDKRPLLSYSKEIIREMTNRDYKIKKLDNFNDFFECVPYIEGAKFWEHNNEYLEICYYNLKEKYIRGQKDFTYHTWEKLDNFYRKEVIKSE